MKQQLLAQLNNVRNTLDLVEERLDQALKTHGTLPPELAKLLADLDLRVRALLHKRLGAVLSYHQPPAS